MTTAMVLSAAKYFTAQEKKIVDIFDNGMNQKILNISVNF
jgi:hypothetical protein